MNIAEKELVFSQNNLTIAENMKAVYEAGKASAGGVSWGVVQNYGLRSDYTAAFAYWECDEITPEYKVEPTGHCPSLFSGSKIKRINPEHFDLSKATHYPTNTSSAACYICQNCSSLEVFPDIGLQSGCYEASFINCSKLHTIEIIRVAEDDVFSLTFSYVTELANINHIEGFIGTNFDMKMCTKLTPTSMKNVIKHLKNKEGAFSTTVSFSRKAFQTLEAVGFEEEDKLWYGETFGENWAEGETWQTVIGRLGWKLTTR